MMRWLSPLHAQWRARTANEQRLLSVLAVLLIGLLISEALIKPLFSARAEARRAYLSAAQALAEVANGAQRAAALQAQPSAGNSASAQSVRSLAGRTAREAGLRITRIQPGDQGRLTLWIDAVPTGILMTWLHRLSHDHGVRVERATITANRDETTVRAQIDLAPGAIS